MTPDKLTDALTELDQDILERYFLMKETMTGKKPQKRAWVKWTALAACLALLTGVLVFYSSSNPPHDPNASGVPGLEQKCFYFETYGMMINAFGRKTDDPSSLWGLKAYLGETYGRFVDRVNEDKAFPQPMVENKPIPYRNEEGFSNISFFVREQYDLPWVFYHPKVATGENFYIKMTYLPENIDTQKNSTASQVIKALSPNSPNINNLGKQHKKIYEQTVTLAEREVTAVVIEYKTDSRNSIYFVYGELLVEVRGDPGAWSEEWFSTLSFGSCR